MPVAVLLSNAPPTAASSPVPLHPPLWWASKPSLFAAVCASIGSPAGFRHRTQQRI